MSILSADTQSLDGLPLWDTFEALFFLGAGIFMGLILGLLFPSLWRTFRRAFRPSHDRQGVYRTLKVQNFGCEKGYPFPKESENPMDFSIAQAFVQGRWLFQQGHFPEALKEYVKILDSAMVTTSGTNQALFEMAGVYEALGLGSQALDTLAELLARKPKEPVIFQRTLDICTQFQLWERLEALIKLYQGPASVRLAIAHALCQASEHAENDGKALAYARKAGHWCEQSARQKILLWKLTTLELTTIPEEFLQFSCPAALGRVFRDKILQSAETLWPFFQQQLVPMEHCQGIEIYRHLQDFKTYSLIYGLCSTHLESRLPEQLRHPVLRYSLTLHQCSACQHTTRDFQWVCLNCKGLETLSPALFLKS